MIDLLDPALHASGVAFDELLRLGREQPVAWREGRRGPGYWAITGHAEVSQAARDATTFSSFWGTRPEVLRSPEARRPLHNLDEPEHAPLKARAAASVASGYLDAIAPAITAVLEERFAAAVRGDVVDAVTELAEPITRGVFAAWLGVDAPTCAVIWDRVVGVHAAGAALLDTAVTDPSRADRVEAARIASHAIAETMTDVLARPGVAEPRALDVLGAITGEALPLAMLLVEAGMPTLADALASALVDLATYPGSASSARLCEELFRRASPIAQFARRARVDTELGGVRIRAGDQIVMWFLAANHDARVFADPLALVGDREPNSHFAFGIGPHRCLGAALSRRVMREVVAAWFSHGGGALAGAPVHRASSYQRGFVRAPMRVGRATQRA